MLLNNDDTIMIVKNNNYLLNDLRFYNIIYKTFAYVSSSEFHVAKCLRFYTMKAGLPWKM
jgi:hypothetical protein